MKKLKIEIEHFADVNISAFSDQAPDHNMDGISYIIYSKPSTKHNIKVMCMLDDDCRYNNNNDLHVVTLLIKANGKYLYSTCKFENLHTATTSRLYSEWYINQTAFTDSYIYENSIWDTVLATIEILSVETDSNDVALIDTINVVFKDAQKRREVNGVDVDFNNISLRRVNRL